jgi:hypothetical protein
MKAAGCEVTVEIIQRQRAQLPNRRCRGLYYNTLRSYLL